MLCITNRASYKSQEGTNLYPRIGFAKGKTTAILDYSSLDQIKESSVGNIVLSEFICQTVFCINTLVKQYRVLI